VIALQAAAGQVSWPQDPEGVRRTVAVIAATARSTLAELDRLGLDEPTRPRGLDDLNQVVARIRAAGTPVDLTVVGELPVACAPVVHRVVQEALTNALRHAPGAAVTVTVSSTAEQVLVRVVDDGDGPGAAATRGYGLVGLAERVALARGTLSSGPGPSGGFAVQAVLPTHPEGALS
jgi:signal transduction histidine kinase